MNGSNTVINVSLFSRNRPIVISHAMRKTPEISVKQQRARECTQTCLRLQYAKPVQNVLRESKWHSLRDFQHFPLPLLSFLYQGCTSKENTFSNKQLKST